MTTDKIRLEGDDARVKTVEVPSTSLPDETDTRHYAEIDGTNVKAMLRVDYHRDLPNTIHFDVYASHLKSGLFRCQATTGTNVQCKHGSEHLPETTEAGRYTSTYIAAAPMRFCSDHSGRVREQQQQRERDYQLEAKRATAERDHIEISPAAKFIVHTDGTVSVEIDPWALGKSQSMFGLTREQLADLDTNAKNLREGIARVREVLDARKFIAKADGAETEV